MVKRKVPVIHFSILMQFCRGFITHTQLQNSNNNTHWIILKEHIWCDWLPLPFFVKIERIGTKISLFLLIKNQFQLHDYAISLKQDSYYSLWNPFHNSSSQSLTNKFISAKKCEFIFRCENCRALLARQKSWNGLFLNKIFHFIIFRSNTGFNQKIRTNAQDWEFDCRSNI